MPVKTLVAAMVSGSALAGGCAMAGDERPKNPWVLVDCLGYAAGSRYSDAGSRVTRTLAP